VHDVPPGAVVAGNPARVIKQVADLTCSPGWFERPYTWPPYAAPEPFDPGDACDEVPLRFEPPKPRWPTPGRRCSLQVMSSCVAFRRPRKWCVGAPAPVHTASSAHQNVASRKPPSTDTWAAPAKADAAPHDPGDVCDGVPARHEPAKRR